MKRRNVILGLSAVSVIALGIALASYQKNSPTRALASIAKEFPIFTKVSPAKILKIKEQLQVACDSVRDEVQMVSNDSQMVMLKFKKCSSFMKKKAISYKVKNSTNGYQGQIFSEKLARLTTDYIQLDHGPNIIELEISLNDGQKINKKIIINRITSI